MTRHVVFGTGQVGHPLVEQLIADGHDVVAVNRDGRGHFPGARVVGGDATDAAFTTGVCQGADVVYGSAGHKPKFMAAGRTTVRAIGLFKPEMRQYLHTLYQFTDPWVVDDGKFRATFGDLSTPLDEALVTTLAWYADRARVPTH